MSSSSKGSGHSGDKPPPSKGVAKALAFRSKKQPSVSRSVDYVASKLRSSKLKAGPLFQEEVPNEEISITVLKNARKTGILSLGGRNLTNVPPRVWRINELDEKEKVTSVNVSMDNPSEDKWWEFVDLSKLIIANNVITEIPAEIAALVSLTALDAHDNKIAFVAKEIGTLQNLQRIDLGTNRIASLPDEMFNLKRLVDLKLGHNQMEEISKEISRLSCLRHLDLSNNKLTSLPPDMGFLSFITQLNISGNRIKEIPPDFGGLSALRVFDASDNGLTNLSNCTSEMRRLEVLSLQKNKLKEIPNVEGCIHLKELFMQNNSIRVFDSKMFRMTKIQLLDFRYNKIETLEIERSDLEYVDRLYFNNNNITSIPDDLPILPSLKQVTLESNPLRGIRPDILMRGTIEIIKYLRGRQRLSLTDQTQIKLQKSDSSAEMLPNPRDKATVEELGIDVHRLKNTRALNLVSRSIKIFDEKVFEDATEAKVTTIDVSKNLLTQFPANFEGVCQFLTELKLDFNRFTQFPAYLGTCTQLQYLSFQNNLLTQLPLEFANLKNLREINFGYNKFTEVPACLYELPMLEILIGPDNKITDIRMEGLEKLQRLAVLDLRNNDIRHAPPELGLLSQLRSLNIEGNAFRVPGHAVLSQGSEAVLSFLRNKVTQHTDKPLGASSAKDPPSTAVQRTYPGKILGKFDTRGIRQPEF